MPDKNNGKNTENDIEIIPSMQPDLIPDAAPVNTAETAADEATIKKLKYRFWLSLIALILSALFGTLALGAVAAGYGLANEMQSGDPREVVFTFKVITAIFITLSPTCIWVAYKFRPGGN